MTKKQQDCTIPSPATPSNLSDTELGSDGTTLSREEAIILLSQVVADFGVPQVRQWLDSIDKMIGGRK